MVLFVSEKNNVFLEWSNKAVFFSNGDSSYVSALNNFVGIERLVCLFSSKIV